MKKVKNTIPVYDICALGSGDLINKDIIAEPFGAYLKVHPNLHLAHRHSFYHIVFFTKGSGYHTIDFEKFDVIPLQIYFMIPGQVHSWNFTGEPDGYVINFGHDFFQHFLSNDHYTEQFLFFRGIASESVVQLSEGANTKTTAIFEQILNEVKNQAAFAPDYIRVCLIELFITVQRTITGTAANSLPQPNQLVLHNFRKLIDKYFAEKRLPKEYAEMLYITPNHLNALCTDLIGKPAGEVIRDRILLEAKRLLINADASISGIAAQLNFSDNSHFTKFFKKHTGATPEEFRKSF